MSFLHPSPSTPASYSQLCDCRAGHVLIFLEAQGRKSLSQLSDKAEEWVPDSLQPTVFAHPVVLTWSAMHASLVPRHHHPQCCTWILSIHTRTR